MVHIVEETFDVNVHHIMQVAQLHILVNLSDSVLLAAIGTEPITVVMKLCFTNGLQYLQYALLNQSVEDGRGFPVDGFFRCPYGFLLCGHFAERTM